MKLIYNFIKFIYIKIDIIYIKYDINLKLIYFTYNLYQNKKKKDIC